MKHAFPLLMSSVVFISGCALSPQTVTLSPDLEVQPSALVQKPNTISLKVEDARQTSLIGKRGGVYKETANITTEGDITRDLVILIGNAFRQLGYNVTESGANVSLTVTIAELRYQAEGENTITAVETAAEIKTVCRNGDFVLSNQYRITDRKDVLKAPSERSNEELINATLGSALERMLVDDKLFDCLDK